MPQTYASAPVADDIIDDGFDRPSRTLEQAADRILLEGQARPGAQRLRAAVRQDVARSRLWAARRIQRTRTAIQTEPVRAGLYALGAGLLLGLLMRR